MTGCEKWKMRFDFPAIGARESPIDEYPGIYEAVRGCEGGLWYNPPLPFTKPVPPAAFLSIPAATISARIGPLEIAVCQVSLN